MDFELGPEHIQIKNAVREFCVKEIDPYIEDWEREEHFPIDVVKKMGELGFYTTAFPEEYGGANLGFLANAIVAEELSRSSIGVAGCCNCQMGTCPMTILLYGNETQKDKYLPGIISGKLLGCFGVTEPNAATDVAGIESKAIRQGDHYVLNGSKIWITGGTVMDVGIAFAKTDPEQRHKGLSAFIIEKGLPGLSMNKMTNKLGMRCSDTAELYFDDCIVPKENLIGQEGQGFEIVEGALTYGRVSVAARALGVAQACVDVSIKYANSREQFGQKIGNFQMNKQIIADMVAGTEAARLLVYRAGWLQDKGLPSFLESTMAKLFASETAVQAALGACRIHGAYSYHSDYPVARLYRDAVATIAGEGTSNIQRLIIANQVLGVKRRSAS